MKIKFLPIIPPMILSIGVILRVAGTGASAIWYDESNMIYRAGIPFLSLWTEKSENSGDLLLEILLRPIMAINHSIWLLRLPSIVAGLISLWLVWKLMQRLDFSLRQQITTCLIVAFLPGLIWLSQDARTYGLLACIFLAALWFALESGWLGLLAVCGLSIYVHNIGPVMAVTALIIAAWLYPWKIRRILLVALFSAIAWIPAIVHILQSWIVQQPWQPQLTFSWLLYSTIRAIWPMNYKEWFFLVAGLILLRTAIFLFSRNRSHGRIVPLLAWTLPVGGLIIFSLITCNNVVLYRTIMPTLIPFSLWLGWEMGRQKLVHSLAWSVMLIGGLMLWHPSDRGGHLDLVADQIRSQWRLGDTLVYTTGTVGQPFDYYLADLPHTWDDTVQHPFLYLTPIPRISVDPPTGFPLRSWVVIPRDGLVTPKEQAVLDDRVKHLHPVFTVAYMQAATIDVFLVEEQPK